MNASEAPVEALAFSYLEAFNNNLWTLIAVFTTAAVSFWRVRTSSPPSHIPNNLINDPFFPSTSSSLVDNTIVAEQEQEQQETSISSPVVVSSPTSLVFETQTKTTSRNRKFSVYYQLDDDDDDDSNYKNEVVHHRCDKDLVPAAAEVGDKWEPIMMKMKMEKYKEVYSYQDLSVLDGSIVRLWEGCRRRN